MPSNKKILVTGASQGIGLAITKRLVKEGYHVEMLARDEDKLTKAAKTFHEGSVSTHVLNLSDMIAVKAFTKTFTNTLYGIVNNAGICKTARIDEDTDPFNEVIHTNLHGMYHLTRGLVKQIQANGRIVNISSQLGIDGRAGYAAYSASKFGVIGLTKCWAHELGNKGITVNVVCPGWVLTEMVEKDSKRLAEEQNITIKEYFKDITASQELKRVNSPEEVASLVNYLISEEAGGISGREYLMQTIWNQE